VEELKTPKPNPPGLTERAPWSEAKNASENTGGEASSACEHKTKNKKIEWDPRPGDKTEQENG
jgi:hypothetical protein